jgi:hypothetical protein
MLSTWLNQKRLENKGAEPVMSAADVEAATGVSKSVRSGTVSRWRSSPKSAATSC